MDTESTVFSQNRWSKLDKLIYLWRSRLIKKHLGQNQIICDLGCGEDGYFLQSLAATSDHCIGFDLKVVPSLSQKNISLYATNLEGLLPLTDQTVDIVISLAVIEHLNTPEQHVSEARRILKPGGLFILTTPGPMSKPILETLAYLKLINQDSIKDHKQYLDKASLLNLFTTNNFQEIRFRRFQGGLNQLIVGRK